MLIKAGGGDIGDFVVSTSTARREGIRAVTSDASNIKNDFKNSLAARDLTLHFDGKAVKEYTAGVHKEKERIALLLLQHSPPLKSLVSPL